MFCPNSQLIRSVRLACGRFPIRLVVRVRLKKFQNGVPTNTIVMHTKLSETFFFGYVNQIMRSVCRAQVISNCHSNALITFWPMTKQPFNCMTFTFVTKVLICRECYQRHSGNMWTVFCLKDLFRSAEAPEYMICVRFEWWSKTWGNSLWFWLVLFYLWRSIRIAANVSNWKWTAAWTTIRDYKYAMR